MLQCGSDMEKTSVDLLELAVFTRLDMMPLHRHVGENSTDQQNNVFQPGAFGLLDDNEARGLFRFYLAHISAIVS